MIGILGYYAIFLLIGLACGSVCPSHTVVNGWNSVGHYYEEEQVVNLSEQFGFIAIPIFIIAFIILYFKTKKDIKKDAIQKDEDRKFVEKYEDESIKKLVLKYKKSYEKEDKYESRIEFCMIFTIPCLVLALIGVGLILGGIVLLIGLYSYIMMNIYSSKLERIKKKLKLSKVDIVGLDKSIEQKVNPKDKPTN